MKTKPIRLAIFGVGNCASSLIQAIDDSRERGGECGLESPVIGGHTLGDVRVVLAYDVSDEKVGLDLCDALQARPNCTTIYKKLQHQGIKIRPGILQDGLAGPLSEIVKPHEQCFDRQSTDIELELREAAADVAVCYLPTGARKDVQVYAMAACRAGVAFVNCCPEPVVHDEQIRSMFERARIPLLGDDIKSHAGATALHTMLIEFLQSRNIKLNNTYQLNIGGNADFKNLADQERSATKRYTKRAALKGAGIGSDEELLAGPTGFVPFLQDRKTAYIHLEGTSVLGMRLNIELRLDVEDSPNTVSIVADAIRIAMLTKARPDASQLACAHLFKNPLKSTTCSRAQSDYVKLICRLDDISNDLTLTKEKP